MQLKNLLASCSTTIWGRIKESFITSQAHKSRSFFSCFCRWNFVKFTYVKISMTSLQHHFLKKLFRGIFKLYLKLLNFVISLKSLHKISYISSKLFFNAVSVRILPTVTRETASNRWKTAKCWLSLRLLVAIATTFCVHKSSKLESLVCCW